MAENQGPVGQGTVVPSPVRGTLHGPKQPPPATAIGGGISIPNTQHTVTQERGWPPNPASNILAPSGRRESQLTTDHELQIGAAPGRVLRQMFARVFGYIGPDLVASFPYNAEFSTIPHQYVPRAAQRTGPMVRGYDDNAPIPAVYAGNPRVG